MRVIAVANHKGGCGKTTTSINFGACLAFLQKKVLLVDLDPQGHTTCGLGIRPEKYSQSLYDWLRPDQPGLEYSKGIVKINSQLFLIPSHGSLSYLEEELANQPLRYRRLKQALLRVSEERPDIEYAIIDCPPNLGTLTFNALEAADEVVIPIEPSFFSLHGLAKISETLSFVGERRERALRVHALLVLFDSRTCFAKEVYDEVKSHFREQLFRAIIHESVALKEAAGAGQSIVQYDSRSPAFKDYLNLAMEYLEREWNRLLPEEELGWSQILAQRYGPKRVAGGVLFQAVSKNAHSVEIAGDFNNWISESLVRRSNEGLWQKVIPITRGTFRYKFIVDGEWQIDPYQPVQRENAFGSYDSFLELV